VIEKGCTVKDSYVEHGVSVPEDSRISKEVVTAAYFVDGDADDGYEDVGPALGDIVFG